MNPDAAAHNNQVASSPFNKAGADVVLRACNKVDFYVYKAVLLLASDFFEDMFSLNQPPDDSDTIDGRPVIEVSETSNTLDMLLRLCYPVDDPNISLAELDTVLSAAIKYEMREAIQILSRTLQTYVQEKPREAYAVACRHMLETEASMAAQRWKELVRATEGSGDFALTLPGVTFIPEMEDISALAYHNLLSYLRTGTTPTHFCQATDTEPSSSCAYGNQVPAAFTREDADVVLQSSDNISFRAHKLILSMNGAESLLSSALNIGELDSMPVFHVDVAASALAYILRLCYPAGMTSSSPGPGSRTYDEAVRLATKYNMEAILRLIRHHMKYAFRRDHLARYLISMRYGWNPEAQDAARRLADNPLHDIHSEALTTTTASAYQTLLEYHYRYQIAVMEAYIPYASIPIHSQYSSNSINVSQGQWRQLWFNTGKDPAGSERYIRTMPYMLAELAVEHARKAPSHGSLQPARIISLHEDLKRRVDAAVKDLRVSYL
ncbi:hypothetical protein EIP86_006202 [Pleurotus ostreatoroseus]|nr:hypothetical protein EIP86_006202 [Pleurotus ostreatoroseus]